MRRVPLLPLVLAGSLAAVGCAGLGWLGPDDLTVQILDVSADLPRAQGLPLKFRVAVANRTSSTLDLVSVRYRLSVNGEELEAGSLATKARLEAGDQTELELPLDVPFASAAKGLKSLVRRADDRYRLEGVIEVDAPLGTAEVPYESEGSLGGR